ncbi:MAG: hypothetical protein ABIV39_02440, partial [Verrucomicrobiota bacterium]
MNLSLHLGFVFVLLFGSMSAQSGQREVIQDPHFQRGFILWKPEPGKHVRYGELPGTDTNAAAVWGLSQWSSKFPIAGTNLVRNTGSDLIYSNSAKTVAIGASETMGADLLLGANAGVEYGPRARQSSAEPWVHLLVEQEFEVPASLKNLSAAQLHVEARLRRSHLAYEKGYSPDVHAAQFQIFFTLQNRNRSSRGFGDLLWFGVPIYDNRHRFVPEFKAQDFGGTAKFIFTSGGKSFTAASAHDGEWLVIEKDLLPLMREALETAWARNFLKDSKELRDYSIGGMNMGWELPGTFDVEMQVRNLSLK